MKRRKFFGSLLGGAGALAVPSIVAAAPKGVHIPTLAAFETAWKAKDRVSHFSLLNNLFAEPYGIWDGKWWGNRGGIGWTGWKMDINSSIFAAQWLLAVEAAGGPFARGTSSRKRYFVSSTPGVVAEYEPGYMFDVSMQEGQAYLRFETLELPIAEVWAAATASKVDAYKALDAFARGQF